MWRIHCLSKDRSNPGGRSRVVKDSWRADLLADPSHAKIAEPHTHRIRTVDRAMSPSDISVRICQKHRPPAPASSLFVTLILKTPAYMCGDDGI